MIWARLLFLGAPYTSLGSLHKKINLEEKLVNWTEKGFFSASFSESSSLWAKHQKTTTEGSFCWSKPRSPLSPILALHPSHPRPIIFCSQSVMPHILQSSLKALHQTRSSATTKLPDSKKIDPAHALCRLQSANQSKWQEIVHFLYILVQYYYQLGGWKIYTD